MDYLKIENSRYLSYISNLNIPEWDIYLDKKGDVYTKDIFSTNNIRIIQSYLHRNDFKGKIYFGCNGESIDKINVMWEAIMYSSIETMKILKDIGYGYTCWECGYKDKICDNHEIDHIYINTAIKVGDVDKLKYLHSIGIYCHGEVVYTIYDLLDGLRKNVIEYLLFDCECPNLEEIDDYDLHYFAKVEYADIFCKLYDKGFKLQSKNTLHNFIKKLQCRIEELESCKS